MSPPPPHSLATHRDALHVRQTDSMKNSKTKECFLNNHKWNVYLFETKEFAVQLKNCRALWKTVSIVNI